MSLSKVSKARLLKLVAFMAKLPSATKGHLNMKAWVMHEGDYVGVIGQHGIKSSKDITSETLIQCGMSACALVWGCLIPSFKKAGLRLEEGEALRGTFLQPVYRGARDMDAAEEFFHIDSTLVERLFGPGGKETSPQEWAAIGSPPRATTSRQCPSGSELRRTERTCCQGSGRARNSRRRFAPRLGMPAGARP